MRFFSLSAWATVLLAASPVISSSIKLATTGPKLSFWYATEEPDTHNWAALYPPGVRPDNDSTKGRYVAWQWALAPDGPVYINRRKFNIASGKYDVYLLRENYSILSGPVPVDLNLNSIALRKDGDALYVDYYTDKADNTNWVGTYKEGNSPSDESTKYHYYKWQFAPGPGDTLKFNAGDFTDGNYSAYLLAKNAYGIIAGPQVLP